MTKMTKKDYFKVLREVVEGVELDNREDVLAFIDKEVERLANRKASKSKTQKENEELVEVVYDALANMEAPVTVTELQKADEGMAQYSNQKLSALLKKLVEAGRVVRTADKKVARFAVATDEDAE